MSRCTINIVHLGPLQLQRLLRQPLRHMQCCCAEARSSAWGEVRHVLLAVFGEAMNGFIAPPMVDGAQPHRRFSTSNELHPELQLGLPSKVR